MWPATFKVTVRRYEGLTVPSRGRLTTDDTYVLVMWPNPRWDDALWHDTYRYLIWHETYRYLVWHDTYRYLIF